MKLTATDLDQHIAQRHSPLVTRSGGARIDTDLLFASGAMEGPDRPTRPLTLTWWTRLRRLLKGTV